MHNGRFKGIRSGCYRNTNFCSFCSLTPMFQKLKHWTSFWCIPHCNCTVAITNGTKKGRMKIGCNCEAICVHCTRVYWLVGWNSNARPYPKGVWLPISRTHAHTRLVCEPGAHGAPFGAHYAYVTHTRERTRNGTSKGVCQSTPI